MFQYARYRMEVTRVAQAILSDEKNAPIEIAELIVIQNRLYEHMTGKRPIASDEWLNAEQTNEKINCPLLKASRSSK